MRKLLYLVVLLVAVVACQEKQQQEQRTSQSTIDSITSAAILSQSIDRAIAVIDSFENTGDLSYILAARRRGEAYLQYNMLDEAGRSFRKATTNTIPKDGQDSISYITCICNLAQLYAMQGNYGELLSTAVPMMETLNTMTPNPKFVSHFHFLKMMLHMYLGYAQGKLDRDADAQKSYDAAYESLKEMRKLDTTWGQEYNCMSVLHNITLFNEEQKNYEKMAYWLARTDSLVQHFYEREDAPEAYRNKVKNSLNGDHMTLALAQNKPEEAERYYELFKNSEHSQNVEGRYRLIKFLIATHRYAEAADAFPGTLNDMVKKFNLEPSYELLEMLTKKFEANMKAGRKDSAYATAAFVLENLDSAITHEKRGEAAKLATIYETKQKDEEIAQQQIELNRQKIFALMIAMGLITAFFIIYTWFRRRAARRMAEMKAQQERIESELRIARDIQMSMVPSTFPEREGLDMYAQMTPAKEVGGDLYGYVLIGDRLYFAVGDVSGKGVPASLFMAQATRLFRTLAAQGMMPAEICTRMNDALTEDNEQGMFVTFFLGLIDLQSGHLQFCNAGHNPPIIGGDESNGEFMQMESNAPIGLFPGIEFKGEEIESIKGRALFVYTDGLNEAEDMDKNQFGDDRLLEILRGTKFDSARQVIDMLAAQVEQHRNGAEPNDDLTMMCIHVN